MLSIFRCGPEIPISASAPHLQRAIRNPEPLCGSREVPVRFLNSHANRNLGGLAADLFQFSPERDRMTNRLLETAIRPIRLIDIAFTLARRHIAEADRSRPNVPITDASDGLLQIADVAGIFACD